MDGTGGVPCAPADAEVHVAGWGAGICFDCDGQRRTIHDACISRGCLLRGRSALALFHDSAETCAAVESIRYLGVGTRNHRDDARHCGWHLDIFPLEAIPLRRGSFEHPVRWAEALAFDFRVDFRAVRLHLGL